MAFFEKIERKFGKYAISNLMMYLTAIYAVGFAISLVNTDIYYLETYHMDYVRTESKYIFCSHYACIILQPRNKS